MKQYKVLVDFEDLKAGEIIDLSVIEKYTAEAIESFVADGILELVPEDANVVDTYVVSQEQLDANPFLLTLGLSAGVEVPYDPAVVISREEAIAQGIDVEAIEAATLKAAEVAPVPEVPVVDTPKVLMYMGKEIISDGERDVSGKTYHTLRLADGTMHDLTDEEYATQVKAAK